MELVRVSMTVSRIDSHAKIKMKNENDSEFRILFFSEIRWKMMSLQEQQQNVKKWWKKYKNKMHMQKET